MTNLFTWKWRSRYEKGCRRKGSTWDQGQPQQAVGSKSMPQFHQPARNPDGSFFKHFPQLSLACDFLAWREYLGVQSNVEPDVVGNHVAERIQLGQLL